MPAITYTDSLDEPGATLYVSPQMQTILHYAPEELMRQPDLWFRQLLHPDDRERVAAAIARCHATGEPLHLEYRMFTREGQVVWLRDSGVLIRAADGRPLFMQGVVLNITEEKFNAQALREREQALHEQLRFAQQLMDTIPNPIFYKDIDGRYLGCNTAFETHLGLTREEILGRTVFDVHEHATAQLHHAQDQLLLRAGGVHVYEGLEHFDDGSMHDVQNNKAVFTNEEGAARGFVGVMVDITVRKQMEEALRTVNERLSSLIKASPLAIITTDTRDTITSWNFTAERMFGWKDVEVLGRINPLRPSTARGTSPPLHARVRQGEMLNGVQGNCQRKNGAALDVSLWSSILHDQHGEVAEILYLIEDATERKQAHERELILRQMQEAERLRSEFLSCISHELKTPLTPILGAVDLLKSGQMGELNGQQQILVDMLDRQSRRLQRLINDLLDIFQLEKGRMSLTLRRVELREIIAESLLAFEKRYREKNLYLQAELGDAAPAIWADAQRIGQVLDNLLENALKFTQTGGVTITLSARAGKAQLRVADTGIGLTRSHARRIFEPFYQVEAQHQGVGLGLAIVKQLVEAQQGSIRVASPGPTQGTTFTLVFPLSS